jgi:type VI secretion system protein ImpK
MMTTLSTEKPAPNAPAIDALRGALALSLQEPFTAAIRLRSNQQVASDASAFRAQIKQLLGGADQEARRRGSPPEYVRLAIYAFVAFLDESVLNSNQPMFGEWPRQPLQEEIFGDHTAGETFFVHLDELLSRQDSEALADTLEVFLLCLLLGFRGRFGTGDPRGTAAVVAKVREKIDRIRGGVGPFAPAWALPEGEVVPAQRDAWVPRLGAAAFAMLLLAAVTYGLARLSLHGSLGELRALTSQLLP